MSVQDNKNIARKWVEAFGARDFEQLAALAAPNIVDKTGIPGMPPDLNEIKMQYMMYHTAFPDIKFTVEYVVADEQSAMVTWRAQGTHKGPLQGIPPTGKSAVVVGANLFKISNGKVVEQSVYFDRLAMLEQLGLAPTPAPSMSAH